MKTVINLDNNSTPVKNIFFMFLSICLIPGAMIEAQTISESVQETAHFGNAVYSGNTLSVYNIRGDVTIEGYDGDEILITAEKWVEAGSDDEAKVAIDELKLVVEEMDDEVLIYVDAPFVDMKRNNGNFSYNVNRVDRNDEYEFQIQIIIQVPKQTNINSSTITDGVVAIRNVTSEKIIASNVNGDVLLELVSGTTNATAVNGNIRASYRQSPHQNSEYRTVNGSIEVEYPEDLSANISFHSLRGDLFTDFENIERLNSQATTSKGSGTHWQINKFSPIRIGDGGPELQFNVVNGDVYLKKINS